MGDISAGPWPNNPYAPGISRVLRTEERTNFAGYTVGAVLYGIVIVFFFQCMDALLDPINRKGSGVKWGLVAHTAAMFLFVTIYTAMTLDILSISFVDNREFPGDNGVLPPGPVGYQLLVFSEAISIVPEVTFFLNNWLADGLLLYRCCIIYAVNYWVVALPCLMYLASLAMGIVFIYQSSQPRSIAIRSPPIIDFGAPFLSISFSLNILLTCMIVARLVFHRKNIRNSMGATSTAGGFYKEVATIVIESSALYALSFLLFMGLWAAKSSVQYPFLQILAQTQVIAPFLIILRVASRRSLKSQDVDSGNIGSIRFRSGDQLAGSGYPMRSMGACDEDTGEFRAGVEMVADHQHDDIQAFERS